MFQDILCSIALPFTDADRSDPASLNRESTKRAFEFLTHSKRHQEEALSLRRWYEQEVFPVLLHRLKVADNSPRPLCRHGMDCETCDPDILTYTMMVNDRFNIFSLASRLGDSSLKLKRHDVYERYILGYAKLLEWKNVPTSRPWYRQYPEMRVDWVGQEHLLGKLVS